MRREKLVQETKKFLEYAGGTEGLTKAQAMNAAKNASSVGGPYRGQIIRVYDMRRCGMKGYAWASESDNDIYLGCTQIAAFQNGEEIYDEVCKTPGKKIRSKGKGRGKAIGKGKGPVGRMKEATDVPTKHQLKIAKQNLKLSK